MTQPGPTPTPGDWRGELRQRVRRLRSELAAIIAYYDAHAARWHLENARRARGKAA